MIILSLFSLIIYQISIKSLERFLETSLEISQTFDLKIIQTISFTKVSNYSENNIKINEMNLKYDIIYSNPYQNITGKNTSEDCYDSLDNKLELNCLNGIYNVKNSNFKIKINNKYFPLLITDNNTHSYKFLKTENLNISIITGKNITKTIPSVKLKILPGIRRMCILNKVINKYSFNKFVQNLQDYEYNRLLISYLPHLILILSIYYNIHILLIYKFDYNFLRKSCIITLIPFVLLIYLKLIIIISIYLKTYLITYFIDNVIENNCYDDEIGSILYGMIFTIRKINDYSLIINLMEFSIAIILTYKIKIIIALNLEISKKEIKTKISDNELSLLNNTI